MNYLQPLTLSLGLVAAVAGIYFADTPPFTHIAAGAVVVATGIGIVQALQAEREAAFVREMLGHLARSFPPSAWWKDKVNRLVEQIGRSKGYFLRKIVHDRSDFRDPEACSIFVFRSSTAEGELRNGLLVLTPRDYSDLSSLGRHELHAAVTQLSLAEPGDESTEALQRRVGEVSAVLYALPHFGESFKVATEFNPASRTLAVTVGQAPLIFNSEAVDRLLKERPIERDLYIAQHIEKLDPALSTYVQLNG